MSVWSSTVQTYAAFCCILAGQAPHGAMLRAERNGCHSPPPHRAAGGDIDMAGGGKGALRAETHMGLGLGPTISLQAHDMVIPLGTRTLGFLPECLGSFQNGFGKPYGIAPSLTNSTSCCTSLGCGVSDAAMPSVSESFDMTKVNQ